MDTAMLARLGAVIFVGAAIAIASVKLTGTETVTDQVTLQHAGKPGIADPIRAELQRCQQLGEAGPRDAACLKAWAASRRRFLTTVPSKPVRPPSRPTTTIERQAQEAR